jgi:hypothetical protein
VRRHRVGVAATALLMLSLIGGMLATLAQSHKAQQAKANSEAVSEFLSQMLNYADPNTALRKGEGQTITVKDVLDRAATQLDKGDFSGQSDVKAKLNFILGDSYASKVFSM